VTVADPLTGAPVALTVERGLVTSVLRTVLYEPGMAALVPLVIGRAEAGDFGPLVAMAAAFNDSAGDALALGMMLSVVCAEDVPRIGEAEGVEAARGTFLGEELLRSFQRACERWPRGAPPAGFGEPVRSEAPVLLLSGEVDPVTPPSWAEEAAKTLPRGRHFVVPGVGHGASAVGCVPRLIADFLEAGDAAALDGACVQAQKRPPFFVSFAGPTP
jgi:pimeloyl-ACP methyl ester carboxylesterase